MARHTLYIVTDRRVILKVGYVYTRVVNIPLGRIRGLSLRRQSGGAGDIQLDLEPGAKLAWATLAPHARLLRFVRPAPLLRAAP